MDIYIKVNQTQRWYFTVSDHIYVSNIMIMDEQITKQLANNKNRIDLSK